MCYIYRIFIIKLGFCATKSKERKPLRTTYGPASKCSILTDIGVVVMFGNKFFSSQKTNGHDIEGLLTNNYKKYVGEQYVELGVYAESFITQYQMYSIIIILNMWNVLNAMRVIRIVHWIILIIERTFNVVKSFLVLLIPAQLFFAFLTNVQIGPFLQRYFKLMDSFKMQFIMMMGQQDSLGMYRNAQNFTIWWTFAFIIFFAYFFLTASIVAFEQGFDETVQSKGYPEDFGKSSNWQWQQYAQWMLAWLPYDQLH